MTEIRRLYQNFSPHILATSKSLLYFCNLTIMIYNF